MSKFFEEFKEHILSVEPEENHVFEMPSCYKGFEKERLQESSVTCVYCGKYQKTYFFMGSLYNNDLNSVDYSVYYFSVHCSNCKKAISSNDKVYLEIQCDCCNGYTTFYERGLSDFFMEEYLSEIKEHGAFRRKFENCVADYKKSKINK